MFARIRIINRCEEVGTSELSVITKNKAFQPITIQLPVVVVNNFASVSLNSLCFPGVFSQLFQYLH